MVVATQTAFFSLPEVRLGFAPGPLIPFFLRGVSARHLRRYLLSGERFTATEALRIGLVHELCEANAGDAALLKLIEEVLLAGPNAAVHAKELLRYGVERRASQDRHGEKRHHRAQSIS